MYKHITLAMTGASGLPYAFRLLECLKQHPIKISLVLSQAAHVVAALESDMTLPTKPDSLQAFFMERYPDGPGQLEVYGYQQWTAPIASGSGCADAMVVCPCTSGTMSAIAHGGCDNLLERAADVMLKERKPLLIVLRETPLSTIHLENALKLSQSGAVIMPACPGFYQHPQSIDDLVDFMVARILDHLKIPQTLLPRWGE